MELKNKTVTVLGMGVSGQEAAKWVLSQGARVICSDIRPLEEWPKDLVKWCDKNGVEMDTGGHEIDTCLSSDLIVVSPGVPPDIPVIETARRSGIDVIGELALAAFLWKGPIIGITGTNGKTTTTMLVHEMLKDADQPCIRAGNIGTPLSAFLEGHAEDTIAVLEISSFQLDYFPRTGHLYSQFPKFNVTAWLNLAPDHLDRYHDIRSYGESKAVICGFQGPEDWAVFNLDDPELGQWRKNGRARRLYFGDLRSGIPGARIDTSSDRIDVMWPDDKSEGYDLGGWSLKGRHNIENLACAILISRLTGAGKKAVQTVIRNFSTPPHRLQWVAQTGDIDYYDDSKATNVASVLRALESMDQPTVLIAGGCGKGEDYTLLARATEKRRVRGAILIGKEAEALAIVLSKTIPVQKIHGTNNGKEIMKEAVRAAASLAEPGDAILLSPACASFDMFKNYEERGKAFQEAVGEL